MYLTATSEHWACDIEANGYRKDASIIWCLTLTNCVTKEEHECLTLGEFQAFQATHPLAVYVGHNFLTYDAPVLARIWFSHIPVSRIVDTYVLSQLYSPNLVGGHSLEAWGHKLKYPKGEWSDFSRFTPEMLRYCKRDTRLTALLFLRLSARMAQVGFTERGCQLEHLAWHIIQNKQKQNGFPFNREAALELLTTLRDKERELVKTIEQLWPPELRVVATRSKATKQDGSATALYLRDVERFPSVRGHPDGSYDCLDWVSFNLGSPPQRIEKLRGLGWEPTNFTKKGNPKIDEDELLAFSESAGIPEAKALAQWIVVNGRANMVQTWLDNYNEETGCIHGSLFLASTLRYKHSGPNSANIPAVRTKDDVPLRGEEGTWTYECRDLWHSGGDGWTLVGLDGKGLQARCLAHNIAKVCGLEIAQDFVDDLLEGDIHKKNMARFGFPTKPASKKAFYTILMGGGSKKIAVDQIQFGWKAPSTLKDDVIEGIKGFSKLIKTLERELERTGRITLVDGSRILVPSPHMVIPYLLQGDESRLMKQAMVFLEKEIVRHNWLDKALKVADIHDEWQYRVRDEIVDDFIAVALPCFIRAGESFNYLIRIDGDAQKGRTWAETH